MRHITPTTLILAALALPFAACGSDDVEHDSPEAGMTSTAAAQQTTTGTPDSSTGGKLGADAFIGCFNLGDYIAEVPSKTEESAFAGIARSRGFKAFPVNVTTEESKAVGVADVYLVFFESPENATEAAKDATTSGGEKAIVRGPAVLAYGDPDTQKNLEPAVNACLN